MVQLKRGDIIGEGMPFAHCVTKEFRKTRCHHCLKLRRLGKCAKCKVARYCSVKCQNDDWKYVHQSECDIFRKDSSRPVPVLFQDDSVRLVLRCMLILHKSPSKADEEVETYRGLRSFSSLISHTENIFKRQCLGAERALYMAYLFKSLGLEFDVNNFKGIFGRVMINSHTMVLENNDEAGFGLYLGASVIDHSCVPNVTFHHVDLKMQIKVIRKFFTEEESPAVCYIDCNQPKKFRQILLKERYFFTCKCIRCSSTDDYKKEADSKGVKPLTSYQKEVLARNRMLNDGLMDHD